MNAKVFTVEAAQSLLPKVRDIVHDMHALRRQIVATRERVTIFETLWGDDVRHDGNPDGDEYRALKRENRRCVRRFRAKANRLDAMGCHIKDLDQGIVGVFHVHDGQVVFMSWHVDEPDRREFEAVAVNARLFTLDEARLMLPRLREIFAEFDRIQERVGELRQELGLLEIVWGETPDDETRPGLGLIPQVNRELAQLVRHGRELERELYRAGCQLKDFQNGLIDFYSVLDGQIVFLCWKRTEPDILNWHPLDGGFTARRRLGG